MSSNENIAEEQEIDVTQSQANTNEQDMAEPTHTEQEPVTQDAKLDEETAAGEGSSQEETRLAELTKLAEENQQRYLRVQADFDNFRRRTMKEKEELGQYASMKLVTQLLPVVDNFDRAVTSAATNKDYESLAKGVEMIFRQFEQILDSEGVKAIAAVGEPFNPEFHQAIMQVDSEEYEEGIVVEEVLKGYMMKDKVLRPAMVKVSS